jgi:hypothetical protein
MAESNQWVIVEFRDDQVMAVVPKRWLETEDGVLLCAWPEDHPNMTTIVNKCASPEFDWSRFQARKLKGFYGKDVFLW